MSLYAEYVENVGGGEPPYFTWSPEGSVSEHQIAEWAERYPDVIFMEVES